MPIHIGPRRLPGRVETVTNVVSGGGNQTTVAFASSFARTNAVESRVNRRRRRRAIISLANLADSARYGRRWIDDCGGRRARRGRSNAAERTTVAPADGGRRARCPDSDHDEIADRQIVSTSGARAVNAGLYSLHTFRLMPGLLDFIRCESRRYVGKATVVLPSTLCVSLRHYWLPLHMLTD